MLGGLRWSPNPTVGQITSPLLHRNNEVAIDTPALHRLPNHALLQRGVLRLGLGLGGFVWPVLGQMSSVKSITLAKAVQTIECVSECHPKVHVLKGLVPSLVQLEEGRNPKR